MKNFDTKKDKNTRLSIHCSFRILYVKFITVVSLILICFILLGCKKNIEVGPPPTSINTANVFTNDATAAAVLTGVYTEISNLNEDLGGDGLTSISLYAGLSADEFSLYDLGDVRYSPFYMNDLTPMTNSGTFWNRIYSMLYNINSAIEGVTRSNSLTSGVKDQLIGEALFLRAFSYFYLVNLYGNVPLILSTDYKHNALAERSSATDVYKQIINDLIKAKGLLNSSFLQSDAATPYTPLSILRVRPTKWAASALLARVYLYTKDYSNAELEASLLINNSLFSLSPIANTFKMNSSETIWALQPVGSGTLSNTGDGALFILPSSGPNSNPNNVYLNSDLVNSFEANDQRKVNWLDSVITSVGTYYYPYKYKVGLSAEPTSEYIMVLRLAEQYLIRAEARLMQGKYQEAIDDINTIRNQHGGLSTPLLAPNTLDDGINIILHERRIELFSEWGHRWFDLKRTNKIDSVMMIVASQKAGSWNSYKAYYPIPQSELDADPFLRQNDGY